MGKLTKMAILNSYFDKLPEGIHPKHQWIAIAIAPGPVLPSAVASAPESPSAPSPPQGLRGSLKTGQSEPSLSVPENPRLSKKKSVSISVEPWLFEF
jgi:hypothetical protein